MRKKSTSTNSNEGMLCFLSFLSFCKSPIFLAYMYKAWEYFLIFFRWISTNKAIGRGGFWKHSIVAFTTYYILTKLILHLSKWEKKFPWLVRNSIKNQQAGAVVGWILYQIYKSWLVWLIVLVLYYDHFLVVLMVSSHFYIFR